MNFSLGQDDSTVLLLILVKSYRSKRDHPGREKAASTTSEPKLTIRMKKTEISKHWKQT
jgi:hypothetical protein